jgi:hypothetical protein
MTQTVHKWFWLWDFDKEEDWLNDMAAKGMALTNVGVFRYEFEAAQPGEYRIGLEYLDNWPSSPESQNYINFLKESGLEHVGSLARWIYVRARTDSPNVLHSDTDSRIKHLSRLLPLPLILSLSNFLIAMSGLINRSLSASVLNFAVAALMAYGTLRIYLKKRKLEKARILHE